MQGPALQRRDVHIGSGSDTSEFHRKKTGLLLQGLVGVPFEGQDAQPGHRLEIAASVATLLHLEYTVSYHRDGGMVKDPDSWQLEDIHPRAEQNELVVGRLHLCPERPVDDDVRNRIFRNQPIELLNNVFALLVGLVFHEKGAVTSQIKYCCKFPSDLQESLWARLQKARTQQEDCRHTGSSGADLLKLLHLVGPKLCAPARRFGSEVVEQLKKQGASLSQFVLDRDAACFRGYRLRYDPQTLGQCLECTIHLGRVEVQRLLDLVEAQAVRFAERGQHTQIVRVSEDFHNHAYSLLTNCKLVKTCAGNARGGAGRCSLGGARNLVENWHSKPASTDRSPAPFVHATDDSTELEFRIRYRAFVDAFRAGALRLRERARELSDMFPLWAFPPALPFNAPA
jgi:hypothetical protein